MTAFLDADEMAEAVEDCSFTVDVTRFGEPLVAKGRKVAEGETENLRITAMIAPMSQAELRRFPEGSKVEGSVLIISTTQLRTVQTSEFETADHVLYNGITYQIQSVNDWNDLGGFYEMMGERLDR